MTPLEYDNLLIEKLIKSNSRTDASKKLHVSRTVIDRLMKEYDIEDQILHQNNIQYKTSLLFRNRPGQKRNGGTLRNFIISEDLIKYECAECDSAPLWNGKVLVLQLDHINGLCNDDRLENLRFLCPNCHSQTETYSNKNRGKVV